MWRSKTSILFAFLGTVFCSPFHAYAVEGTRTSTLDQVFEGQALEQSIEPTAFLSSMEMNASNADPCPPAPATKPNPCATSHKPVFYDNDFSYLCNPDYSGCCFGDNWKRMAIGSDDCCHALDIGGELRFRYHHERGMGQQAGATRFDATDNDFLLTRMRMYANYDTNELFRFYVEGIYAGVGANSEYIPRPIDRNYGDLLNAFFDTRISDAFTLRLGRQELIYGNQRLVSPLDWSNTRRTFEGIKLLYVMDDWKIDAFFTNPVIVNPDQFDEADYQQQFYGMYTTYNGFSDAQLEGYYLGYDNENPGAITNDFSLHTVGSRINGNTDYFLYEMEGGYQFGRQSGLGQDQSAGFATIGIGQELACLCPCWKPTAWIYYDYASGDAIGGDFNRFNQLFPLAHKYLGYIDAVQRSNIEAINALITMKPSEKLTLLFWYYHFMSNQSGDIVPAIGDTPPQSLTRNDFGDELDILATYQLNARSQLMFGWSHLWRGSKILAPEDADFIYAQWQFSF